MCLSAGIYIIYGRSVCMDEIVPIPGKSRDSIIMSLCKDFDVDFKDAVVADALEFEVSVSRGADGSERMSDSDDSSDCEGNDSTADHDPWADGGK